MSEFGERSQEFRELADEFCNGTISDERLGRLEELLLADEEARREFAAYFHLHTEIHFAVRAGKAAESALRRIEGRPSLGGSRWRTLGWYRRRIAAVAAAAMILLAPVGWLWLGRRPAEQGPRALAAREAARVAPRPTTATATVTGKAEQRKVGVEDGLAMVVAIDRVDWEPDATMRPAEGELLGAARLRFRSGRLTLSMLSGALLTVEGPADLELVAIDRIFCRRGRIRTKVPKDAEGLVISSPSIAVIDLGTEFGLNVDPGGRSRVKVFEGQAEAVLKKGTGRENLTLMLGASKSAEIDARAGKIGAGVETESYANAPTLTERPLEIGPDYAGAVLAAKPWGYWRFEALERDVVTNEVPGRPPLRRTGAIRLTEAGSSGNRSASFGSGSLDQFLEMDGMWRPTSGDSYAVELWFRPGAIEHASLVSMTAPKHTNHHVFFLEMTSRNRHAVHPPASVRFLDRWPAGTDGGHNIYSPQPYVPFRWHHLVGQMNKGRMELYLNGQAVRSSSADLGHKTQPCQVIVGRLSTGRAKASDDSRWLYGRAFPGQVDEVALYDRPLNPEEIRDHHRRGGGPAAASRPIAGSMKDVGDSERKEVRRLAP